MRNVALTAVITAVVCVSVTVTTGLGAGSASDSSGLTTIPAPGTFVVPTLDLFCTVFVSDPNHHDPGPVLFCDRNSTSAASERRDPSAAVYVSRFHMRISQSGSNVWNYVVARTP